MIYVLQMTDKGGVIVLFHFKSATGLMSNHSVNKFVDRIESSCVYYWVFMSLFCWVFFFVKGCLLDIFFNIEFRTKPVNAGRQWVFFLPFRSKGRWKAERDIFWKDIQINGTL